MNLNHLVIVTYESGNFKPTETSNTYKVWKQPLGVIGDIYWPLTFPSEEP